LPATPKSPKGRKSPIIVHAPSRTDAKGTSEILNILDELRAEGLMFTINVLVEKSNEDVLAALDECDFVIDQLYSDSPMATFASEAAAFGKPAIVGSYIKAAEFEWAYSMHGVPPSLVCHPNDLKAAIRSLITDIELRLSLGLKAQEYVKNFLAPEVVAKRYLLLFRRKAPRDWTCIPGKIYGCPPVGMTVSLASRLLRESMEFHDGSFFLPAKVAMRKSFEHLMRSDVFR
jgi:glycosyltransferase involved in cell wall biosynthesis